MGTAGGKVDYLPENAQAYDQARGLADDNATAADFVEGVDIAAEREAENKAALKIGKGGKTPYPKALVTPHGR